MKYFVPIVMIAATIEIIFFLFAIHGIYFIR